MSCSGSSYGLEFGQESPVDFSVMVAREILYETFCSPSSFHATNCQVVELSKMAYMADCCKNHTCTTEIVARAVGHLRYTLHIQCKSGSKHATAHADLIYVDEGRAAISGVWLSVSFCSVP